MVGYGDAMGVTAKVVEDFLGTLEGSLGVDDPTFTIELIYETAKIHWTCQWEQFSREYKRTPIKFLPQVEQELCTE